MQRAKQELEEIYCDQTQTQVSLDDLGITSPKSKFALQTGYQHQKSLALLGGGGMAETMCHSKVCKDFMDDHFEEVNTCTVLPCFCFPTDIQYLHVCMCLKLYLLFKIVFKMKYLIKKNYYLLELHVKCWSDHNPAMHNHFEGNGVGGGGGGIRWDSPPHR